MSELSAPLCHFQIDECLIEYVNRERIRQTAECGNHKPDRHQLDEGERPFFNSCQLQPVASQCRRRRNMTGKAQGR